MNRDQPAPYDTFADQIREARQQSGALEQVLSQVVAVLSSKGIRIQVNLVEQIQSIREQLDVAAVHSTALVDELQGYRALAHTAAVINSSLDLDEVLNEVIDTLINISGAERAYLMLRNHESGELVQRAARNWDRESINPGEAAISSSIVEQVARTGQPVISTNAQADDRFATHESVLAYALRSILCVPLRRRGEIVGVMYTDNRFVDGVFTEKDRDILSAFADQAAIAIENARLFGRVKADLDQARREVAELRIQIDEARKTTQVNEITESEFFQQLVAQATRERQRRATRE